MHLCRTAVRAGLVGLVIAAGLAGTAAADSDVPVIDGPYRAVGSVNELVRMSRCELEQLYRHAAVGPVPRGFAAGRAIFEPGSRKTVPLSRLTRLLWQGKVFEDDGIMINRVFGLKAVRAVVFYGESWLDGGPTLILDYQCTSRLFSDVRDEMREVAPGLYLGLAYLRRCPEPELAVFFALDARCPTGRRLFHLSRR